MSIFLAFALYFSLLLAVGFLSHRKSKSETDFVLGDRDVNYWVTALSAHASDMSAWLFMVLPGAVFAGGLAQSWIAVGVFIGMLMNWQFVARRIRIATEATDTYTLSSFFGVALKDRSSSIRFLTALMTVVFLAIYLSAGLIAMGFLFESVFGINYTIGITVATAVVLAYTLFGGFATIAWVDFFQGIFLLFVIVSVAIYSTIYLGGVDTVWDQVQAFNVSLSLVPDWSLHSLLGSLSLALGWGLGYFGQPHIVTKFMGIRDPEQVRHSKYIGMTWQAVSLIASACIGFIGIAYFSHHLDNSEMVFVEMVKGLFSPFTAGIILCALLAANISTMDSQILVCASVMTEDIYRLLFNKDASSQELLKWSRISVVIVGICSYIFASFRSETVTSIYLFAWAGLGCTFGPLVLMTLYSKRVNHYGALAGIIFGSTAAFTWPFFQPYFPFETSALLLGFPLSCLVIWVVSLCTQRR